MTGFLDRITTEAILAFGRSVGFIRHFHEGGSYSAQDIERPLNPADANVVTSLLNRPGAPGKESQMALHAPAIDIDVPVTVVPSSTPGHYHLYIDKEMTWRQYSKLLTTMAEVGIVEWGYVRASEARRQTVLRLPGVKKEEAS